MTKLSLKLYIAGQTGRSRRAVANLHRICETEFPGEYEVAIIDVLDRPQVAETQRIIATPTLIKELPPPVRRIIGDMSDPDKVLMGLDMARPARPNNGGKLP